jgi:hypothetical protein
VTCKLWILRKILNETPYWILPIQNGIFWVSSALHPSDMLLYSYEAEYTFFKKTENKLTRSFIFTFGYKDGVLSLSNSKLGDYVDQRDCKYGTYPCSSVTRTLRNHAMMRQWNTRIDDLITRNSWFNSFLARKFWSSEIS